MHPQVLRALASGGHGSRVLISDFNFAHATNRGPNAEVVYANFAPGLVRAVPILELIAASVPIESAAVIAPARHGRYAVSGDPPVWAEFRRVLAEHAGHTIVLDELERFAFYAAASSPEVCLTIATGETAFYSCLLLTIGAIPPDQLPG